MSEPDEFLQNFPDSSSMRKVIEGKIAVEDGDLNLDGLNIINGITPETLEALLAKVFPDDIWLVDRLIPVNGITVVSALPGSFKTWLLLDIARAVASGGELFGQFGTKRTGVLVIDEENGEHSLQQRLKKLGADPELPIYFLSDTGFKLNEDTIFEIADFCELFEIGLVTFDSLIRVHDAEENSSKDMARVFRAFREIAKQGISVLITHHNRKPSNNSGSPSHEMRGSSDILAALDCHLALSRVDQKQLILTQTKVRLAEELAPLEIQIVSDDDRLELVFTGNVKPIEDRREVAEAVILTVLDVHQVGLNQRQLLDTLGRMNTRVNARTLRSILQKMLDDGKLVQEQGKRNAKIYKLAHPPQENE